MLNQIHYIALIVAISISSIGQLFLKYGAVRSNESLFFLFQPFVIVGLGFYFISSMFYIYAIKEIPISIAFPTVSISYVVVSIISHFIWKEPLGMHQILALCFISFGVILLYRT